MFLDHCKVQYSYEEQGFEFSSGGYLPDFRFLKARNLFLEIKPRHLLPTNHFEFQYFGSVPIRDDMPREVALAIELSAALPGGEVVIVYGDPLEVFEIEAEKCECAITINIRHGPRVGLSLQFLFLLSAHAITSAIDDAANAARAARFEHGEMG